MKIFFYKLISGLKWNQLFIILFIYSVTFLGSQDLKKEIFIPFPQDPSIEESSSNTKKKREDLIHPEQKPDKNYIIIPFPDDKNLEQVLKKIEFEPTKITTTTEKNIEAKSANPSIPLENIFIVPEVEIKDTKELSQEKSPTTPLVENTKIVEEIPKNESKDSNTNSKSGIGINTKELITKPTKEIGKALVEKSEPEKSTKPKTTDSSILKKSKLYLGEYAKEAKEENSSKETKNTTSSKVESKTSEATSNIPLTNLPNSEKPSSKKGKDKKKADESSAPFERSQYYLNRDDKSAATPELNTASSSDGEKANLAKMDQIRLLALERKKNEAKNIIEGISEPEFKFKGLYELAVGLENSAKSDKKLKEEAIPFHLTIITEAPKSDKIIPKSLWALSHLLFTIGDHTPALDHLSEIILKHSNSEYADDAIYLSGRIYEESTTIRNLNRAKKYYELFLKNEQRPQFKNSIYLPFVKKRLELLEN